MKRLLIVAVLLATRLLGANAEVDPNFYIYICFGQSNMEGNAQPESIDRQNIDKRFQLLATCDFSSPARKKGNWYKAVPPLVSPAGGLGPTDYFGRTMVENLPEEVRVGVIPVAMGGSPIEMFDKDKCSRTPTNGGHSWPATTMAATLMDVLSKWPRRLSRWVSSRASCCIRAAQTTVIPTGLTW